jgi:hypothetical protein
VTLDVSNASERVGCARSSLDRVIEAIEAFGQ